MKKILFIIGLFFCTYFVSAQQYIDAVIINNGKDTLFGKIIGISDTNITFDRFNYVFSIPKSMITNCLENYRLATRYEKIHMKQIEDISDEDFEYKTSGYYLRKASRNFYVGLGLTSAGSITIAISLYNNNNNIPWGWFTCGSAVTASGLFFLLRSFYFIDKAGKIMDLERTSIYITPSKDGGIGFKWKF